MVAGPFDKPGTPVQGQGVVYAIELPAWLREFIGPDYWDLYNLDGLFYGTFQDGNYWVVRYGADWLFGDPVGAWVAEQILLGDVMATPNYSA